MAIKHEKNTVQKRSGNVGIVLIAILLAGSVFAATGDVVLKRTSDGASGFPAAVFPHWIHRINYR